jgi:hypothetical protein
MLTLLSPSDGRHEAFALLEKWVLEQDWDEPLQWIVATGDPRAYRYRAGQLVVRAKGPERLHPICRNVLAALPHIKGDAVLIMEDDDYYAPGYVRAMVGLLEQADLVGLVPSRYYNVRHRKYALCDNHAHASLAQTAMRRGVLDHLAWACRRNRPLIDMVLWRHWTGSRAFTPGEGLYVGVKGMPGTPGITSRWHGPNRGTPDLDFTVARSWGLPAVYERFHEPPDPARLADAPATGNVPARPALLSGRLAQCLQGAHLPPEHVRDGRCEFYHEATGYCCAPGGRREVAELARWADQDCPLGRWPRRPPG